MALTESIQLGSGMRSEASERVTSNPGSMDESAASTDSVALPPPPPPTQGFGLVVWRLGGLLLTMRPHQWVKNGFVLAPMVFAREMFITDLLVRSIGAFGVFCLLTGAVYTMNDLVDVDSDATHPIKRYRPIPSGRVPLAGARRAALALVVISLAGAAIGPWEFFATAVAYFLLNVAYSLRLKHVAYLDVASIAAGFVLRVLAGALVISLPPSLWLLGCTALLAMFLGFGKRTHEFTQSSAKTRSVLAYYSGDALRWIMHTLALVTAVVYTLYLQSDHVAEAFGSAPLIYTLPFAILAILRFIYLVTERPDTESPTEEMLRDWVFMGNFVIWLVVTCVMLYWHM
jgi:decaprenyl-phosphate phosphoribosyltransferase